MDDKDFQIPTNLNSGQQIQIIGVNTICRLCASQNDRLIGIYSEEGITNDLSNKINLYLPIKVEATDDLPLQCCWNCASTLLAWHELVLTCVEVERKYRGSQFVAEKQIADDRAFDHENTKSQLSDDDDICDDEGFKTDVKLEPEEKPKTATCAICQKTLSRARDLKRHMVSCHPELTSTPTNVKKTAASFKFEDAANLATKTCTKCQISFETRLDLKKHVLEVHNLRQIKQRRPRDEIFPQFHCDICQKGFTRKFDMQRHMRQMHGQVEVCERKNNMALLLKCKKKDSSGKAFYKCDGCDKTFRQAYNLTRHRTIHMGVKESFCHVCGKGFRQLNGLKRHIDACHNGVKNFSCEVCSRSFSTKCSRDEHMNTHTNNRPYVCDICGKNFKQKASLYVHKMFHSDVFKFECVNCGKKFRRSRDLMVHSWVHTGHRPNKCSKCNAAFRLKHDLNRHLRTHDRVGECVCNVCGSVFSQERYLKVHSKIHLTMKND